MTDDRRGGDAPRTADDDLRALLRAGDPAADSSEPAGNDLGVLRARILHAVHETDRGGWIPSTPWSRRPALAAALVIVILVGALALWVSNAGGPEQSPAEESTALADRAGDGGRPRPSAPRQVHFTAPGGTRIVWTLYPALETPDTETGRTRPADPMAQPKGTT